MEKVPKPLLAGTSDKVEDATKKVEESEGSSDKDKNDVESKLPTGNKEKVDVESKLLTGDKEKIDVDSKLPTGDKDRIDVESKVSTEDKDEIDVDSKLPTEDKDEIDVDSKLPTEDKEKIDVGSKLPTEDKEKIDVDSKLPTEDTHLAEDDEDIDIEDEEMSEPPHSLASDDSGNTPNEKELEDLINTMNEPAARYDWSTLAIRAGITTIIYPTQMAQILMQVGYEPFSPTRSVTLLGRPCLLLPSTGSYLRYIYQVDGWSGIFHGLTPRITQQLLFTYSFDRFRCYFRRRHVRTLFQKAHELACEQEAIANGEECTHGETNEESEQSEFISTSFVDHFREVVHELGSKIIAITISYPVHVVVVRTIAQFVGREHCIRRSLFGEVQAIYQDFGLLGFYRGLVPKLIGETCQGLAVGALTYFVSNQAPTIELRSLLNLSFSVLVSAWTYQFSVVSTTMAVNGSCLTAGQPPFQPVFNDWYQCWKELKGMNVLNRGSSFICRYYTGPTMLVSGIKEPTGIAFGPNHLSQLLCDRSYDNLYESLDVCTSFMENLMNDKTP